MEKVKVRYDTRDSEGKLRTDEFCREIGCIKERLPYRMQMGTKVHTLLCYTKDIAGEKVIFAVLGGCLTHFKYNVSFCFGAEKTCKRC